MESIMLHPNNESPAQDLTMRVPVATSTCDKDNVEEKHDEEVMEPKLTRQSFGKNYHYFE